MNVQLNSGNIFGCKESADSAFLTDCDYISVLCLHRHMAQQSIMSGVKSGCSCHWQTLQPPIILMTVS